MNQSLSKSVFLIRSSFHLARNSLARRSELTANAWISSINPSSLTGANIGAAVQTPLRFSSSKSDHSPQNIKKDRAEENGGVKKQGKDHERVNSGGDSVKKLTKNVKPEQLNPDDGSMEFKEKISPGSTDSRKTAVQARKHPKADVPDEVADKLEDETVEFIKKQSGMSGGASS